jgi:hypothetical protein
VLASSVTLQAQFEQTRLPVSVHRTGTEVTIANTTAVPFGFSNGGADPAPLHAAIAAVKARLAEGQRPQPGADGVPTALSSRGPVTTERRFVAAPMHVRGTIGNTAVDALVVDKLVVSDPGPVHLTVTPAAPDPAALGDNAGVVDLQLVMAQVARLSQYDAYEGVTVPGPSTTRYEYGPAAAPPAPKPVRKEHAHPLTMVLAALAALGLALVSWAAWARS